MPLQSTRGAGSASGFGFGAVSVAPYNATYLIIAGGGAGGGAAPNVNYGGGGGAGGYRSSYTGGSGGGSPSEAAVTLKGGANYTITVGGGGTAVLQSNGAPGVDSSIIGTDVSVTSLGGGSGGFIGTQAGQPGGSGGGGGIYYSPVGINAKIKGSGTANQGYDGGTGQDYTNAPDVAGGGGGGAGGTGGDGSGTTGGRTRVAAVEVPLTPILFSPPTSCTLRARGLAMGRLH